MNLKTANSAKREEDIYRNADSIQNQLLTEVPEQDLEEELLKGEFIIFKQDKDDEMHEENEEKESGLDNEINIDEMNTSIDETFNQVNKNKNPLIVQSNETSQNIATHDHPKHAFKVAPEKVADANSPRHCAHSDEIGLTKQIVHPYMMPHHCKESSETKFYCIICKKR